MLTTTAFGPIAGNAAVIGRMAGDGVFSGDALGLASTLEAMGRTMGATGKGFATASAAMTSLSLILAFLTVDGVSNMPVLALSDPVVIAGLFFGGILPFVFAAISLLAVHGSAAAIIVEVRRQVCF